MLTEKDYCDYDTCVALYELGLSFEDASQRFERNILTNRYEEVPRPLLYEAQKWLRERHKLHITIYSQSQESWQYRITKPHQKPEDGLHGEDFSSFEEALLEGIKEAVKILKEEK